MRHSPEYGRKKSQLLRLLDACQQQHFSTILRLVREDIRIYTDMAGPLPVNLFGIGQCSLFLQQLFRLSDGAEPIIRIRLEKEAPLALFYRPGQSIPYAVFLAEETNGYISRISFLSWTPDQEAASASPERVGIPNKLL